MRVTLVTHETSRTGAPAVALLVARILVEDGHRLRVVTRRPGPLEAAFAALAPTRVEPLYRVRRRLWLLPGLGPVALAVDTVVAALTLLRARPDLVYLNSTSSVAYLRAALWLRRPVVLHGHESASVAQRFVGPTRSRGLLRRATLVACSPSVRTDLAALSGLSLQDVPLVPSVPDGEAVRARAAEPATTEVVAHNGSGADGAGDAAAPPIVVGCCGSVERRKGTDLWLQAARTVRAELPDVPLRFVWVGDVVEPDLVPDAEPGVTFLGPSSNPFPLVARFDIATLPSRDDPFPLVVLEAMLLARPVVAFGVGGVPDQVGDAGIVVRPGDVDAFAQALVRLVRDESLRRELGDRAARRVEEVYGEKQFAEQLRAVLGGIRAAAGGPVRDGAT